MHYNSDFVRNNGHYLTKVLYNAQYNSLNMHNKSNKYGTENSNSNTTKVFRQR